jgi:hypothetical protein
VAQAPLVIDYTAQANIGFTLISDGAVIDTRASGAQALVIQCQSSCFYFHLVGTLTVWTNTPLAAVRIGSNEFTDAHNSMKVDHLIVDNAGSGPGVKLNYVLNADLSLYAVTAGSSGLWLRQVQFSTIRGAASGNSGVGLMVSDGYTFANTFSGLDLEASQICLDISSPSANHNTFSSLYAYCPQPIVATAGDHNLLINPMWGAAPPPDLGSLVGVISFP